MKRRLCLNCQIPTDYGCACWVCVRPVLAGAVVTELVRLAFRWIG